MKKSLDEIYDQIDKCFKKAETELIENEWYHSYQSARLGLFIELITMFGTWHKNADCIDPLFEENGWYKTFYRKQSNTVEVIN